jgi:hypothetical protein
MKKTVQRQHQNSDHRAALLQQMVGIFSTKDHSFCSPLVMRVPSNTTVHEALSLRLASA